MKVRAECDTNYVGAWCCQASAVESTAQVNILIPTLRTNQLVFHFGYSDKTCITSCECKARMPFALISTTHQLKSNSVTRQLGSWASSSEMTKRSSALISNVSDLPRDSRGSLTTLIYRLRSSLNTLRKSRLS